MNLIADDLAEHAGFNSQASEAKKKDKLFLFWS